MKWLVRVQRDGNAYECVLMEWFEPTKKWKRLKTTTNLVEHVHVSHVV